MKHWTFEINESDSGEILISADGSDGSRWQEWINKKEGKLYESNLESMDSHKVTPVEDWAIRTEINLMMHLFATYFQKDMQDVESYQIFEGNVLHQLPDPVKTYWARETDCSIWLKQGFTKEELPPFDYEWKNILSESGDDIIDYKQAEVMMDDDLREETAREIAPCSQQVFYLIYCICHKGRFGRPFVF